MENSLYITHTVSLCSNGVALVVSSYKKTPKDHRSTARVCGFERTISGGIYSGVPHIVLDVELLGSFLQKP